MMNGTFTPRLVFWEMTAGCNLRCQHCRRIDVADTLVPQDLTTAEGRELIDGIARTGSPILVLSGGEPLFRPDVFDLAVYARDKGLPVALATNGTLLDDARADAVKAAGIRRVAISIDGADDTTHDDFRRQPGSLARALAGAARVRARGVSLQFNVTLTRHNVHQRDAIYQLAREHGADALHLFMLVPVGCGVQIAGTNMLTAEEYEDHLRWFADRAAASDMEMRATCAPHYYRIIRERARETGGPMPLSPHAAARALDEAAAAGHARPLHSHTKGCLAGTGVCFVSHRGQVFPCGYLPVEAGSVRERSFDEVWRDSAVFGRLRNSQDTGGKCGACEYLNVCGGCRARAYSETGDFMASEPYCTYTPRVMRGVEV